MAKIQEVSPEESSST
ncbi:hypothetical protein Tco_1207991, partial [Tanacetum coccineum]